MIQTMRQFYQTIRLLEPHADETVSVFDLVRIIDLRLKRLEDHLGIPMPDDLFLLKKKFAERECRCEEDQLWPPADRTKKTEPNWLPPVPPDCQCTDCERERRKRTDQEWITKEETHDQP